MKKKVQKKLTTLKSKAVLLRANGQLPYKLVKFIYDLTGEESTEYVKALMELTSHYMRINGYYTRYKDADKQASADIEGLLKEKGFLID